MPSEECGDSGGRNRFFLAGLNAEPGRQVDLAPISHQLRNVLRLEPGSVITLLDDSGAAYPTRIDSLDAANATGRVLTKQLVRSEPAVQLTLYQCVLKRERFEWVLQKGTELGEPVCAGDQQSNGGASGNEAAVKVRTLARDCSRGGRAEPPRPASHHRRSTALAPSH